jgi:hypothetical protein
VTKRRRQTFPGSEDAVWRALRAALPVVTTRATFWEQAHRVEWSSDGTPFSWGQIFSSSVEAGRDGSAVLTLAGRSRFRPSFGDRRRRGEVFQRLLEAVAESLPRLAATTDTLPTDDRVRYWNGAEWSAGPPPVAP